MQPQVHSAAEKRSGSQPEIKARESTSGLDIGETNDIKTTGTDIKAGIHMDA